MANRPKGIFCKLIIDDDSFDGVDYQEKGEFKTIYFDPPATFCDIKIMFQNRKLVTSGAWPRDGKRLLFLREYVWDPTNEKWW